MTHPPRRGRAALGLATLLLTLLASPAVGGPWFERFLPPEAWRVQFWDGPDAQALTKLEPKALADLVPTQAGLRYCRCPACGEPEEAEPLRWSIRRPEIVTCRKCSKSFPDDATPAKDKDKKVPEEAVEVSPGVTHKYPYHAPEAGDQKAPDERLYLNARRDYEARSFLSKAALYAAARHRLGPPASKATPDATIACVLLLRFAQAYPNYALHHDQPGQAKSFEPAAQPPPYRRGYGTGKWDWTGSLDVPVNLALAYALVRDDPALAEAGKLLGDPHPARTIERELFLAAARFSAAQPDEVDEASLQVDRGLLVVGRLLNDPAMIADAARRLRLLSERGFTFDGLWRTGDAAAHDRVLTLLDGWIGPLLAADPVDPMAIRGAAPARPRADPVPILALARRAGAARLEAPDPEVVRAAWPAPAGAAAGRGPALLGGAGLARLSVGSGADSLDVELRGMGTAGGARSRRQALRIAVGGRTVVGDLDDSPPRPDGFDRASASHNTIVIDGLNQRETPRQMREPAAGGDFLLFAADPDFQVAVLDDPWAYPRVVAEPGGYRQTVVACAGPKARYAVAVFEARGGSRHDQLFHGPAAGSGRWLTSVPTAPGPDAILDPGVPYLPSAHADDGRWFVQAFGAFRDPRRGSTNRPSLAEWRDGDRTPLRLHLLQNAPHQLVTATVPAAGESDAEAAEGGPSTLIVRREAGGADALVSTFVTVFDPTLGGPAAGNLRKVGRVADTPGFVVLYLESPDGAEHLVINLQPGKERKVRLADGRELATDGRVVRARRDELMLAGGTVAALAGVTVRQTAVAGALLGVTRSASAEGRGWFDVEAAVADPARIAGRTLTIRHGDGVAHNWTVARAEPLGKKSTRFHVREEPGFALDGAGKTPAARYYQFPATTHPAPHKVAVGGIAR